MEGAAGKLSLADFAGPSRRRLYQELVFKKIEKSFLNLSIFKDDETFQEFGLPNHSGLAQVSY